MANAADEMRYFSASAGDLSTLNVRDFAFRFQRFKKIHTNHIKLQMRIAGHKI